MAFSIVVSNLFDQNMGAPFFFKRCILTDSDGRLYGGLASQQRSVSWPPSVCNMSGVPSCRTGERS